MRYLGNMFTEALLSNGRPLRLHSSGFQPSCDNILFATLDGNQNWHGADLAEQAETFSSARWHAEHMT
jgi:hypothetical protein